MSHTVGILAPNGAVGSAVVKYLLPYHVAGRIKLIVLHKPGGPPKSIPESAQVESREIDLERGDIEATAKAVQGINAFVSTIAPQALLLEVQLAEALAKSNQLVYFIPSLFGRPWRPEETEHPEKQQLCQFLFAGRNRALELGLKITTVDCGYFDYSMFKDNLLGADIRQNTLHMSAKQHQNPIPITSTDYLGAAIASLVVDTPADVAGKTLSAVEFRLTGQELANIFAGIHHGQPPKVSDFTDADLQTLIRDEQGFGVAIAGYRECWEVNAWDYSPPIRVIGKDSEDLENVIRRFL